MKKILLVIFAVITVSVFVGSFPDKEGIGDNMNEEETETAYDENEYDSVESLNDIRFAGFTDVDWWDNGYIGALRMYIDGINDGRIKDLDFEPHRKGF